MRTNLGTNEKYMRIGLGLAAAAAFPFFRSAWGKGLLGLIATSALSTGFTRYCPIKEALTPGLDEADPESASMRGFRSRKEMRRPKRESEKEEGPEFIH